MGEMNAQMTMAKQVTTQGYWFVEDLMRLFLEANLP